MSKSCGLKKLMCPGPVLLGTCPFLRDDCTFHEDNEGFRIVTDRSAITRIVRQVTQRDQVDDSSGD